VAATLKAALGVDTELIEGSRGEFTVWVDDKVVARKSANGFPSDAEALETVQHALGP